MTANSDLVHSLYAAFATGDLPALLARLDPEVRWNEAEGFPYAEGNPHVGPEAIVAGVFGPLMRDWDGWTVEVGELAGDGDVVTMFGRYKAKNKATGKPLDVQCSHTWWIRGGRVVRFQQMVDTASVRRAMA